MKKKIFNKIIDESKYIGILFVLFFIILKIAFYKEQLFVILKNTFYLFWAFIIPGYFVILYWSDKLELTERIIIGSILSASIIGTFSYYLGLIGINIKFHFILLPIILIAIGIILSLRKKEE